MLSLAVGVGANAAIFSVGYPMLVHPLPYPADRLVMLCSMNPSHGVFWTAVAPANLLDWQAQAKSFEAIAGYRWQTVDLTGGDRSERLRGLRITHRRDRHSHCNGRVIGSSHRPDASIRT